VRKDGKDLTPEDAGQVTLAARNDGLEVFESSTSDATAG